MAAHAKFLFDVPLDGYRGGRNRAEEETARAVAAAREEAFSEGVAEGRRQQAAETDAALEQRAGEIMRSSAALLEQLAEEREKLAREAACLAYAAAKTLAPALIAREPHAELDALFTECIANLANAPHLVIRVPDGDAAALRERLEKAAHAAGYDGRIVVLHEEALEAGDCSIEWADGGLSRNFSEMTALVRESIERRYGRLEQEPPTPESQSTGLPADGNGDSEP